MIALATAVGRIETAVQYLKEAGDRRDEQFASALSEFGRRLGALETSASSLSTRLDALERTGTLLRSAGPGIVTAAIAVIMFLLTIGALIKYGG